MNPKTVIKGKIHYVGVNDRNKHLFEGMWPLPYGVSYNSYLIDDETVALVDTVDICYFEVYLRKIKSIIGERPIPVSHHQPYGAGPFGLYPPDKAALPRHHHRGQQADLRHDRGLLWRDGRTVHGEGRGFSGFGAS